MNDSTADRPVRVEDVARVAGVSPITVSRALRTPEKVKPATLERVLDAVRATGYQINAIASSLRSGQSSFITVLVASLQNLHYAAAMQGVIDAFEGSRFHLTFTQMGYAEDIDAGLLRSLLPFKPAAILFSGIVRDEGARDFLKSLDIPVMEMWGDQQSPVDMLVTSPAREGGRLMGEHFADQGFRHIAYIGHTTSRALARIEGFRQALEARGSRLSLLLSIEGTTEMEDGIAAYDEVMRRLPECDAMLFGTDVMAAGALVRAQELGIAIPAQLALAGYGDLFFARHTRPTLTSVHTGPYDVGHAAGKLLRRRVHGETIGQRIIQVPVTLEVRGSTLRRPR